MYVEAGPSGAIRSMPVCRTVFISNNNWVVRPNSVVSGSVRWSLGIGSLVPLISGNTDNQIRRRSGQGKDLRGHS